MSKTRIEFDYTNFTDTQAAALAASIERQCARGLSWPLMGAAWRVAFIVGHYSGLCEQGENWIIKEVEAMRLLVSLNPTMTMSEYLTFRDGFGGQ